MTWAADTLADFVAWLDMTPPADDATATRALNVALATVETWLDRELEERERVQEHHGFAETVLLRAWPVASVASITQGEAPGAAVDLTLTHLDKRTGRLRMPALYALLTVTYTAGFATMPADLEFTLWQIAAALYPAMKSAAGAAIGPAVARVSTPDVGTVEFRAGAAGGEATDALLGATLSPAIEAALERYRAESIVGGA
jgi:hypothetical protein